MADRESHEPHSHPALGMHDAISALGEYISLFLSFLDLRCSALYCRLLKEVHGRRSIRYFLNLFELEAIIGIALAVY